MILYCIMRTIKDTKDSGFFKQKMMLERVSDKCLFIANTPHPQTPSPEGEGAFNAFNNNTSQHTRPQQTLQW